MEVTALSSIPPVSDLMTKVADKPSVKRIADRSALVIALGALTYLAASAAVLFIDWMVGVPVVLAAGIIAALVVNRAVGAGVAVDERIDAVDRMLVENEREYALVWTGVEAEWALLTRTLRGFATTVARSVRHLVDARREGARTSEGSVAPSARAVGAGPAATEGTGLRIGDRLHGLRTLVWRKRLG